MTPEIKDKLLDAALDHVVFDGWSDATFEAAAEDAGIDPRTAEAWFTRKGLDLAIAFHQRGDAQMVARMKSEDLMAMRFRDRVSAGVRYRLEAVAKDKEAVRRGSTLFALPQNAAHGAKLIWGTADAIWTTIGDTSTDHNWYTKRATLSAVYGSTVLFWLGDTSEGHADTWEFLDRRIENVMQFEKVKAQVNANPIASKLMTGPNWLLSKLHAPGHMADPDLPGKMSKPFAVQPQDQDT
jgi:ubiquinone biosynthesis protein COQ9